MQTRTAGIAIIVGTMLKTVIVTRTAMKPGRTIGVKMTLTTTEAKRPTAAYLKRRRTCCLLGQMFWRPIQSWSVASGELSPKAERRPMMVTRMRMTRMPYQGSRLYQGSAGSDCPWGGGASSIEHLLLYSNLSQEPMSTKEWKNG